MGAHHGPAKGMSRWLLTTNHKDIGTMYLWFSFAMFILGGAFAMVIRAELFQPGMQLVEPGFFNQMTTLHGLVMVFGAIMPSFVGLANWMIPMMIGAPDMALPRMNNWSFWILPPSFLMLASTLFMEGGAPAFGWTFYAPLSTTYAPPSVTFFIFAIQNSTSAWFPAKEFKCTGSNHLLFLMTCFTFTISAVCHLLYNNTSFWNRILLLFQIICSDIFFDLRTFTYFKLDHIQNKSV